MGGAQTAKLEEAFVPLGETADVLGAAGLASRILNFVVTPDQMLKTVRGPCLWEPNRGAGSPVLDHGFGIFFASLAGDLAGTLIVRAGTSLYRHRGGLRTSGAQWETLATGLSADGRPNWPDMMVSVGDFIIWTNGVDRARLISYDGTCIPLGFDQAPSPPEVMGPDQPSQSEAASYYPNSSGYSWQGNIGTVGDMIDANHGSVEAGWWVYYSQYQDQFGNLGPWSRGSVPARLAKAVAAYGAIDEVHGLDAVGAWVKSLISLQHTASVSIDDFLRQFLVKIASVVGQASAHAVGQRVARTRDIARYGPSKRFLDWSPGSERVMLPDNRADAYLGEVEPDYLAVPVFRLMCAHGGRLVIAGIANDPSLLMVSEDGLPGTFRSDLRIRPSASGAAITAVISHKTRLLALTATEIIEVPLTATSIGPGLTLSPGIGTVSPRSVAVLPDGTLIFLNRNGFYGLAAGASQPELISSAISRRLRDELNRGALSVAVATVDGDSGEYRCAVARAGSSVPNWIWATSDGQNWREMRLGLSIYDMCFVPDWRQYHLVLGNPNNEWGAVLDPALLDKSQVYVLDHEVEGQTWDDRQCVFESRWIRHSENGLVPYKVRELYLGFTDSYSGEMSLRFFRNGSSSPSQEVQVMRLMGTTDDALPPELGPPIADEVVLGTSVVRPRRPFWRKISVDMPDCRTWKWEATLIDPVACELHSVAITADAPDGKSHAMLAAGRTLTATET